MFPEEVKEQMDINKAFPSKFLKASDLGDAQPVVTIDHVSMEEVGKDKDSRPIVYFVGKDKGLVLNKTNANKIVTLLQSGVTEEWEGQKIRLYATETTFGGDTVECIRVKAASPNGKQRVVLEKTRAKPEPEPDDHDDDMDQPF